MKANLLIADPKEADWDMVSETLVGEGSSVYIAGSAGETEELLSEGTFFLVLLGLELLGGSGIASEDQTVKS